MSVKMLFNRKGQLIYYDDETKQVVNDIEIRKLAEQISRVNIVSKKELKEKINYYANINGKTREDKWNIAQVWF